MDQNQFQRYAQIHIDTTKQIMGIELKFDEESILKLDDLISSAWPDNPPVQLDNVVLTFGSFLGESIRQTLGGEWVQTETSYGLKIGDATANVFSKVRKRFLNGMEDSLSYYYLSVRKLLAEDFKSIIK
jgi:hypothetical protein